MSTNALALIGSQAFDAAMVDMNLNGEKSHPIAGRPWCTRRAVHFLDRLAAVIDTEGRLPGPAHVEEAVPV